MSKRIPVKFKALLGELLADWYRKLGKVAPRRLYHEDDDEEGGGDFGTATNKMFEEHPLLMEMPIGASSDLANIITEDANVMDEVNERKEELINELQNKLDLSLENKLRNRRKYDYKITPSPM